MFSVFKKLIAGKPAERSAAPASVPAQEPGWKRRGNDALSRGALDEAAACYREGTQSPPGDPLAWLNLGYIQLEQGERDAARESLLRCESLLVPGAAALCDVWCLLGRERQEQQDWTGARGWFERVVGMRPAYDHAWRELGLVNDRLGNSKEAADCFLHAVALRGDFAEALGDLSQLALREERHAEALRWADQMLRASPQASQAHFARARALWKLGQPEESLLAINKGLGYGEDVTAIYFRGVLLAEMDRHEAALVDFDRALELSADFADALANSAPSLRNLRRLQESMERTDRALQLAPGHLTALLNKAVLLHDFGRFEEALEMFDAAIAQDGANAAVRHTSAYTLFLLGRYDAAWVAYESRWGVRVGGKINKRPNYGVPEWQGEPLTGRTIIVYPEQGLGDSIQFMRYVPLLAREAKAVLFCLHDVLMPLALDLPANCRLIASGEAAGAADFACALLSLPRLFNTTLANVPASVPYVRVEAGAIAKWEGRLGPRGAKLRVGLVWSGNRDHFNDFNRSIPLEDIRRLAPEGIEFFSLQKELRDSDRAAVGAWVGFSHFGEELKTFMDTAALACQMDIVISVDTSVAHLVGALGRPLWLLLPFVPDWRWAVGRSDTPWYPTARLFRQPALSQWDPALRDVMSALGSMARGTSRPE